MYSGGHEAQYGANAPQSPPLHHPVPQHPIPPFSPANPVDGLQQQSSATNRYAPQQLQQQQQQQQQPHASQGFGGGSYPNIFNDPSAQIGIEVGRNAFNYGQEYIGRNINQYVSVSALQYYFQVSNSYVLRKILLVLFPWRHKPWTRILQRSEGSGAVDGYATAREDINAPDMYIPAMAFTTYVLLSSFLAGIHGVFHPQVLGLVASKAIFMTIVELTLLKLGTYLLSAGSKMLDFVAYSGYKFIGITLTMLVSSFFGSSMLKWSVFLYTSVANSFFLLRSLRYILLPDNSTSSTHTINPGQRQRRIQFLFIYSFLIQLALMWYFV
ncbi:protein transport protein Yif1p [Trichomonascus vanleenenianus]|uniref:protein transporter YIF1 n=1 Tax=Trichomonascus vanleenenianus TaxID=2268995 RepID=UPI003ECA21E3